MERGNQLIVLMPVHLSLKGLVDGQQVAQQGDIGVEIQRAGQQPAHYAASLGRDMILLGLLAEAKRERLDHK
jgi:hypothetical protein